MRRYNNRDEFSDPVVSSLASNHGESYMPPSDSTRFSGELASDLDFHKPLVPEGGREDSYLRQAELQNGRRDPFEASVNAADPALEPPAGLGVSQKSMMVVYFTCFVDLLGFGLLFPVLPGVIQKDWDGDATDVGLTMAAFSVGQALGSTWMGLLSDHIGRRPVMNFSLLCSAVTLFAMAYVTNVTSCTITRFVSGLSSATVGTAQAYIADVTTSMEERAKYMRFTQAALSLGIVMGPVIGGFVYQYFSWAVVCYAGAGISMLNFIVGMAYLTESLSLRDSKESRGVDCKLLCEKLSANGNLYFVLIAYFLVQVGWSAFEAMFIVYAEDKPLQLAPNAVGTVFAGVGIAILVTNVIAAKTSVVQKCGEKYAVIVGCLARGGALTFITYMPSVATSVVLTLFIGMSGALIAPSLVAMVTAFSDAKTHGSLLGITQMLGAVSRSFSPYVCGLLYEVDSKDMGFPEHSFPFFLGAAAMVLTVVVLIPLRIPQEDAKDKMYTDIQDARYDPLLDEDPQL
jgi:DHA1 family tetracycline resistance protein-like MFS transporter